jgi:hypothetical protein
VVTFTASRSIHIVLHPYSKPQIVTTNQSFGEPLNTPDPFAPARNIAIALMTKHTDEPIFSDSLPCHNRLHTQNSAAQVVGEFSHIHHLFASKK